MITHGTNGEPQLGVMCEWDLSIRPVKVELLDGERHPLNVAATGFLFSDLDRQWLYLPWHVVTGYDYLDLKVVAPPNRRFVKLTRKRILREGGRVSLGDSESHIISLYTDGGEPNWKQQELCRPHADLDGIGIHVPADIDLVAVPISLERTEVRFRCFSQEDTSVAGCQNGQEVIIAGYPWGYSALGELTPEPLFLSRHIASWVLPQPHNFLLDGVGARGMSGSPMFIRDERSFKLIGVYVGAYFPDVQATGRPQDAYASLGVAVRFGSRHLFAW